MTDFIPWFLQVFLPPLVPLVVALVVTASILFWSAVGWLVWTGRGRSWRR